MAEVVIAGAGIVGISTAIWLQRAGHSVTIVDREGPAAGTSYGNAGVLASGAIVPVTTPGLWRKAPFMVLDKNSPLFLKWSYLPKMIPFLWKFMRNATDAHVTGFASAMAGLLHDSVDQHRALAAGTGAEKFITGEDFCFGYPTKQSFDADAYGWKLRRNNGVVFEVQSGAEFAGYDPLYADSFGIVVRCKNHGRISDPGAYIKALARHFEEEGGKIIIAHVSDVIRDETGLRGFETDAGELRGDHAVLALGAWSKPLGRKMGLEIPLESERGYHIELVNPSHMPKAPMMVAAGKFVITPMAGRIRCAGVVEFGGLTKPPSEAPFNLLKRHIRDIFPKLTYDRMDTWMGHRPSTPDSLPLIGSTDETNSGYAALGHQHVGLTAGPKTGRIVADLISGRKPNMDLAPFSPARYR
ncbi:NAD(P)/FAD-dependent oxidoreductase [Neptunicoccus cionae]|uniref:NAD(P)/FAD-dependent oxidoreductase n=1 Tax=Neptunicoccus cionae TaxID=2035344 RepID=UPI000C78D99C|nr:FAD-dependent oxidoreductase [Amylibacter cionae]PLS23547.1 FAD-dependent oxidoreductase [Amylibacter cionae]